jgi:hypothetical protein
MDNLSKTTNATKLEDCETRHDDVRNQGYMLDVGKRITDCSAVGGGRMETARFVMIIQITQQQNRRLASDSAQFPAKREGLRQI